MDHPAASAAAKPTVHREFWARPCTSPSQARTAFWSSGSGPSACTSATHSSTVRPVRAFIERVTASTMSFGSLPTRSLSRIQDEVGVISGRLAGEVGALLTGPALPVGTVGLAVALEPATHAGLAVGLQPGQGGQPRPYDARPAPHALDDEPPCGARDLVGLA